MNAGASLKAKFSDGFTPRHRIAPGYERLIVDLWRDGMMNETFDRWMEVSAKLAGAAGLAIYQHNRCHHVLHVTSMLAIERAYIARAGNRGGA